MRKCFNVPRTSKNNILTSTNPLADPDVRTGGDDHDVGIDRVVPVAGDEARVLGVDERSDVREVADLGPRLLRRPIDRDDLALRDAAVDEMPDHFGADRTHSHDRDLHRQVSRPAPCRRCPRTRLFSSPSAPPRVPVADARPACAGRVTSRRPRPCREPPRRRDCTPPPRTDGRPCRSSSSASFRSSC